MSCDTRRPLSAATLSALFFHRALRRASGAALSVAIVLSARVALTQSAPVRPTPPPPRSAEELARARVLDQQGAKAYADGRYNDAIRYFEESHRLGGPPFELWNIAKCHVRLDQPEQASEVLERYLATPALPAEERDEATQQLAELRRRPSTVTIASNPTAAAVTLDGQPAEGGKTPTSFVVQPGTHTITLTAPKRAVYTQMFEAKYGRAIILDVPLADEHRAKPADNPYGDGKIKRVSLRGDLGVMVPKYGSVNGDPHFTLIASGAYRFADVGATTFAVGGMLLLTGDSWDNRVAAPTSAAPCGTLSSSRSATALSLFATGSAGWEIAARVRAHAVAGVGVAAYFAGDLGGDVFVPSCSPAPGPKPAFMAGAQVDFALTPIVRLSALPLVLQLQPSFDGARSQPVDASGIWMRATIAIGAGVDL